MLKQFIGFHVRLDVFLSWHLLGVFSSTALAVVTSVFYCSLQ